jgi:hypothetical protein
MEPRRPGSGLWIHRAPDAYLPAAARFPRFMLLAFTKPCHSQPGA